MTDKEVFKAAYQSNDQFFEELLRCLAISQGKKNTEMADKVASEPAWYSPEFRDFCSNYECPYENSETIEF